MITDRTVIDQYIQWLGKIKSLTESTIVHNRSVCTAWADFLEGVGETSIRMASIESVLAYVDKRASIDQVKEVTISHDLYILRTLYHYLTDFGGSTNPTECLPEFVCRKNYESDYLTI
jgi:site-specific recombinase XerD